MLADLWIDQFDEMRLEALVGAFLIGAHRARMARHFGGKLWTDASYRMARVPR
ncbi:MAG TPA: hypothetical protein VKG22_10745 [Stellaceae bacterium]|nr:hypothetical protein [Stellaceae bacterium]HMD67110.1 hypothetical protein [Stellaceae bacterium]